MAWAAVAASTPPARGSTDGQPRLALGGEREGGGRIADRGRVDRGGVTEADPDPERPVAGRDGVGLARPAVEPDGLQRLCGDSQRRGAVARRVDGDRDGFGIAGNVVDDEISTAWIRPIEGTGSNPSGTATCASRRYLTLGDRRHDVPPRLRAVARFRRRVGDRACRVE
jgi:hypothetical protein